MDLECRRKWSTAEVFSVKSPSRSGCMSSQPSVHAARKPEQGQQILATPPFGTSSRLTDPPESQLPQPSPNDAGVLSSGKKWPKSQRETENGPGPIREFMLTVSDVAKRLGMSKQWVRDHIDRREPKIDVVRWGAAVRFRPSDIDRFILQHLNAPRRRRRHA